MIQRCIPDTDFHYILTSYHSEACGGHFGSKQTAYRVLDCGFFWPTLFNDAYTFYKACDRCQRTGNIGHSNQMPQLHILVVEIFYAWGIDFIGPFPNSFGNHYILLAVDYVSKWVEAIATHTDDFKIVVDFVKANIFAKFGLPRAIVSDRGTHFCNRSIEALVIKYGLTHKVSMAYYLQTNGQAEVSNWEMKMILEKKINSSH